MPVLDWIGKKAVVNHHRDVPYRLLHCDKSKSVGDIDAGNLLVQGDNLEALKSLLPYYGGKVKCIYIDPPYNTGNESWVYNDNNSSPEIKLWLGRVVGNEAKDLSRHDKWLCMMYPRLRLLREFLAQDGVILVSIDDFEVATLKLLMEEIFGKNNFIAQLVWDKTRKNDARLFSIGHEYMLVWSRSLAVLRDRETKWREPKPGSKEIIEKWRELKNELSSNEEVQAALRSWYSGLPKAHPSKALSRYKWVDDRGPWRDRDISWPGGGGPRYDVLHPVTGRPCEVPDDGWRFASSETMQEQIDAGLVAFRDDESQPPFRKAHLVSDDEDEEGSLSVMGSVLHRQSQVAVKLLKKIFDGKKVFENPKDHEVVSRIIRYVSDKDSIILDSFSGSGTTAHAVLEANRLDGGSRKFVMVEMNDNIAVNVTSERIKRAVLGHADLKGLGSGFQYCTLGKPLFDADGNINDEVTFSNLAAHVFFCETGSPLPKKVDGLTPLIGVFNGRAIYLLFSPAFAGVPATKSGNVLTAAMLKSLPLPEPRFTGARIVYGEGCTVPDDRLTAAGVTFRQVPYQIEGI